MCCKCKHKVTTVEPRCQRAYAAVMRAPGGTEYYKRLACHQADCAECQQVLAEHANQRAREGFRRWCLKKDSTGKLVWVVRRWEKLTFTDISLTHRERDRFWKRMRRKRRWWCGIYHFVNGIKCWTVWIQTENGSLSSAKAICQYRALSVQQCEHRGFAMAWPITKAIWRLRNDNRPQSEKHKIVALSKYSAATFEVLADKHAGIAITNGMRIPHEYRAELESLRLIRAVQAPQKRPVSHQARLIRQAPRAGIGRTATEFHKHRFIATFANGYASKTAVYDG